MSFTSVIYRHQQRRTLTALQRYQLHVETVLLCERRERELLMTTELHTSIDTVSQPLIHALFTLLVS